MTARPRHPAQTSDRSKHRAWRRRIIAAVAVAAGTLLLAQPALASWHWVK
jgi:hypothetical protein